MKPATGTVQNHATIRQNIYRKKTKETPEGAGTHKGHTRDTRFTQIHTQTNRIFPPVFLSYNVSL